MAFHDSRTMSAPFVDSFWLDGERVTDPHTYVSSAGNRTKTTKTLHAVTTCSTDSNGAPDPYHTQRTRSRDSSDEGLNLQVGYPERAASRRFQFLMFTVLCQDWQTATAEMCRWIGFDRSRPGIGCFWIRTCALIECLGTKRNFIYEWGLGVRRAQAMLSSCPEFEVVLRSAFARICSAVFVHTKGCARGFQPLMKSRILLVSSRTLRKGPRWIA